MLLGFRVCGLLAELKGSLECTFCKKMSMFFSLNVGSMSTIPSCPVVMQAGNSGSGLLGFGDGGLGAQSARFGM